MPDIAPKHRIHALWILDKPERWVALSEIEPMLPEEIFLDAFKQVWIISESNDRHLALIDTLIDKHKISMQKMIHTLNSADRRWWLELPDPIRVYRGGTMENPYVDYSWTTDRKRATWFGHRCHNATPAFISGKVAKKDVLFISNDRNEHEVAVQTDKVMDKQIEQLGPLRKDEQYALYAAFQSGDAGNDLTDPERIKQRVMLRVMHGESFESAKNSYYIHATEMERAGFITATKQRQTALAAIDWAELEQTVGKALNKMVEAKFPEGEPIITSE
jgi:hypothetical protein